MIGLEIVVAESKIQGQLGTHLPVVLNVGSNRSITRTYINDRLSFYVTSVKSSNEVAGVCIAAGTACRELGAVGGVGEGQNVTEAREASSVGLQPLYLKPEGDVMPSLHPLQVVDCGKGVGGQRAAVWIGVPVAWLYWPDSFGEGDRGHAHGGVACGEIRNSRSACVLIRGRILGVAG